MDYSQQQCFLKLFLNIFLYPLQERALKPKQLRKARLGIGLSQAKLAEKLGLADGRTIRKWEAEDRDIPQAQAGILDMMAGGYPEWLICTSPDGSERFIQHTVGPRFIGKIRDGEVVDVIWLDRVPRNRGDKMNLFEQAALILEEVR